MCGARPDPTLSTLVKPNERARGGGSGWTGSHGRAASEVKLFFHASCQG
jgi:hypothetical protein